MMSRCQCCNLHETMRIVPSEGPTSKVMFVGRNPGRDENEAGLPFVGRGGRLLDRMIAEMQFFRSQFYITNLVKCVWENERLVTDKGLVRIKDLTNEGVLTLSGNYVKAYKHVATVDEGYRVEFANGQKVIVTGDHRFLCSGESFKWVEAKDLVGRQVVVRKSSCNDDHGSVKFEWNGQRIDNKDFGFIVGMLLGDGSLQSDRQLSIYGVDEQLLDKLEVKMEQCFGLRVARYYKKHEIQLAVNSKELRYFMYGIGFGYVNGRDKRIPDWVFTASISCRWGVLGGFINSDGSVGSNSIYVSLTNLDMAYDLFELSLSLGLDVKYSEFVTASGKIAGRVRFIGRESFVRISENAPLYGVKSRRLDDWTRKVKNSYRNTSGDKAPVFVEKMVLNRLSGRDKSLCKWKIKNGGLNVRWLDKVSGLDFYKDLRCLKVVKVENVGKKVFYDLTMSRYNNFSICGLISHNCHTDKDVPPTEGQVRSCITWIRLEIELLNPKLIVVMGNQVIRNLVWPKAPSVVKIHGKVLELKRSGRIVYLLHHPGYMLRNPEALKVTFEQDLPKLRDLISMALSEE